jgi:hypothetical protein
MGATTTKMSQFDLSFEALKGGFVLNARATMIKNPEQLLVDNPHLDKRIEAHQHLRDIEFEDQQTKEKLPVHIILGANEYAKIRTSQVRIGRQGEPVAELTRFGWALMSPGEDLNHTAGFMAVNTAMDHERLCSLDVLGLADSPSGDHGVVYQHREQLSRDPDECWYETSLPWKGDHPPLSNYYNGSIRRMHNLVRRLRKTGKLEEYDAIIREQIEEGIVERAPSEAVGREFYMPHRAVVREGAESTKTRVVYDCSAREGEGPSLNDCLDVGPPLGLVSPMTLQGKLIFREACESKTPWDATLPEKLAKLWEKWESSLPARVATRRSLATIREPVDAVELHAFGDASGRGVATTVYAVVSQASGVTQGLVAAKSRLAKQCLTIPRLELVFGHMASNAADNVRRALEGFPVTATYCLLDSTVALHWICGGGEYRQFVANRVRKIQEHDIDAWRHVPTADNPADIGRRGGSVVNCELWWNGPTWLSNRELWLSNLVPKESVDSAAEAKVMREVVAVASVAEADAFVNLLAKYDLKKSLRVCVWISRFLRACRGNKRVGPILTTELEEQSK